MFTFFTRFEPFANLKELYIYVPVSMHAPVVVYYTSTCKVSFRGSRGDIFPPR